MDEAPGPRRSAARRGRAVRAALRRLPLAQREALVLAYWGGLTADEIARRSQVPLGTARAGSGSASPGCATSAAYRGLSA